MNVINAKQLLKVAKAYNSRGSRVKETKTSIIKQLERSASVGKLSDSVAIEDDILNEVLIWLEELGFRVNTNIGQLDTSNPPLTRVLIDWEVEKD